MAVTQCESCQPRLPTTDRYKNEGLRIDTLNIGPPRDANRDLSPSSRSSTGSKNRFEADLSPSLETYRQFLGTQLESLQSLQLSTEGPTSEHLEAALLALAMNPRDQHRPHRRITSTFSQPGGWQQALRKSQVEGKAKASSKSPGLKTRSSKCHAVKKQPPQQHRCFTEKAQSPTDTNSPPLSIENLIGPTSQF
jgi:hypothetical protein